MKRAIFIVGLLAVFSSCEDRTEKPENARGIPGPEKVEALAPDIDEQEENLRQQGYQTRRSEEGDTTYLMQQYYLVFLKRGDNTEQDTTGVAELEKQHKAHLKKLTEEGHASLAGPIGDDDGGEISEVIIFNTTTERSADSLARLDPMVQAGRLEIEVHPWWVAKGGKLE